MVPQLDLLKRNFIREYTSKAIDGELENTIIHKDILSVKDDETLIERIIRKNVGCNIEHIFPVLIYRIRKLLKESDGDIKIAITDTDTPKFLKSLIEVIYSKYVESKLGGLPTSLTTLVRSARFYQIGEEAYIWSKHHYGLEETYYIEKNRFIIR